MKYYYNTIGSVDYMNISHLCYLGNMQIETIFTDWSINETEPEILDIFNITFQGLIFLCHTI